MNPLRMSLRPLQLFPERRFESFLFLCLEEGSSSAPHLLVTNSPLDAVFILLTANYLWYRRRGVKCLSEIPGYSSNTF